MSHAEVVRILQAVRESPENADMYMADLQSTVAEAPDSDLVLVFDSLLDKDLGLLSLLRSGDVISPKSKGVALRILSELLADRSSYIKDRLLDIAVTLHPFKNAFMLTRIKALSWYLFNSKEGVVVKKGCISVLAVSVDTKLFEKAYVASMFQSYMKLYTQNETKYGASVKAALFELFGSIARHYPEAVVDFNVLKRKYLFTIDVLLKSNKPELELIAGALKGLSDFLFTFEMTKNELEQIFNVVKLSILPVENLTRYSIAISGLRLFQLHAHRFSSFFLKNNDKKTILSLHSCIRQMCDHKNVDLSKYGFRCMDSFITEISKLLIDEGVDIELRRDIFWYFLRNLMTVLNTSAASFKDIAQAIRAIGKLTEPIKSFMPETEQRDLMNIICAKAVSSVTNYSGYDLIQHVGAFFESFASFVSLLSSTETSFLSVLDSLSNVMLDHFANIRESQRILLLESVAVLLHSVHSRSHLFHVLWRRIALDALVRTCSETVLATNEPTITPYEDFYEFWRLLFKSSSKFKSKSPSKEDFIRALYDGVQHSIFDLLGKLDLRLKRVSNEVDTSDPIGTADEIGAIIAENPKDHNILVNLVWFCENFVTKIVPDEFTRWIGSFAENCVDYSAKFPLVSSFYKMVSIVLKRCKAVEYFGSDGDAMDVDGSELVDKTAKMRQLSLLSSFVNDVIFRMEQFKDDLLSSCLKVLLVAPREVLKLENVVKPIKKALSLGLSFTPLAVLALDTIEEWLSVYKLEELSVVLNEVLPYFMDYLLSYSEADRTDDVSVTEIRRRRPKTKYKYKKIYGAQENVSEITDLKDVMIRVVKIIGRLGAYKSALIANAKRGDLAAWSSSKKVLFKIPFQDFIVDIYFDDILPMVIDLAENSADRRTKVAACEFLHSVILLMIGGSQAVTEKGSRTPYHDVYARLFPVILRLAVDLDQVTRELFRPLSFQIIHWLTKNSRYDNPETIVMLDCCFDCLVSDASNLRDFGSDCVTEFFKWSIKHTTDKELEQNPMNIKSLFKRFYQLCQHKSPLKRLGAALVFGKIYKNFREHDALVDQFCFEILYYLLFIVKMGTKEDVQLGVTAKADLALKHIVKIISLKSTMFTKETARRRTFPGLKERTINGVLNWLLDEMGSGDCRYSQNCIVIIDELAKKSTYSNGVRVADTTGKSFIESKTKNDSEKLFRQIEKGSRLNLDTNSHEDLKMSPILVDELELALDCYSASLKFNHISPNALLQSNSTILFRCISAFGRHFVNESNGLKSEDIGYITVERTIFLKLLWFITLLCKSTPSQDRKNLRSLLLDFVPVLSMLLFQPSRALCNIDIDSERSELFRDLGSFFSILRVPSGNTEQREVMSHVKKAFLKHLSAYIDAARKDVFVIREIVFGLKVLASAGVLDLVAAIESLDSLYAEVSHSFGTKPADSVSVYSFLTDSLDFFVSSTDLDFKFFQNLIVCHKFFQFSSEAANRESVILIWRAVSMMEDSLVEEALSKSRTAKRTISKSLQTSISSNNQMRAIADFIPFIPTLLTEDNEKEVFKSIRRRLLNVLKFEQILSSLIAEKFPLKPSDLEADPDKFSDYSLVVNGLLQACLRANHSVIIEKALFYHICQEPEHKLATLYHATISKKFSFCSQPLRTAMWQFSLKFIRDSSIPVEVRYSCSELLLLSSLESTPNDGLRDFFVSNVKEIMEYLAKKLPDKEKEICDAVFLKSITPELNPSDYHSTTGKILLAYVAGTARNADKELTMDIVKYSSEFKKGIVGEVGHKIKERYYMSAYNALGSALLSTQSPTNKAEVFITYLLREKPKLWDLIVDTTVRALAIIPPDSAQPNFFISPETDQIVRDLVNQSGGSRSLKEASSNSQRSKYLSSQYLVDTTLTQSLEFQPFSANEFNVSEGDVGQGQSQRPLLHLERTDPYRWHKCLPLLVSLLSKLPISEAEKMPPWMEPLHAKAEARETHFNIKMLICRLILSLPTLFKPFASQWWRFLANMLAQGGSFGTGVNYLIEEITLALIDWSEAIKKDMQKKDQDVILSIMRYFVENSNAGTKFEIRTNIRLFRSLVELFENLVIAPTDSVFKLLTSNASKLGAVTGIYLIQSFAVNNIALYDSRGLRDETISRQEFFGALIAILVNSYSDKYIPCAECIGCILKGSEGDKESKKCVEDLLNTKLNELYSKSSHTNMKPYVVIVNKISLNYPEVMKLNCKRLLFIFPKLDLELKAKILEAILSWCDKMGDLFSELINLNLLSLLRHRDVECQTFTLRILAAAANSLKSSDVAMFLETAVETFLYHPSERCRAAFFSLMYELHKSGKLQSVDTKSAQLVKKAFLVGLRDPDPGIKQSMSEYINGSMFSKVSLLDRVNEVLNTAPKMLRVIRPARRTGNSQEEDKSYYADDADRRKKKIRKLVEQQKQARERKVTLFRKYREGELPDIEIKYKDVILPLRALVSRDSEIAMHVFAAMISEMHARVSEKASLEDTRTTFETAIASLLKQSTEFAPTFIGSILRICYQVDEIRSKLEIKELSRAAEGSSNYQLGALVIERFLESAVPKPASKRAKTSQRLVRDDVEGWIDLAKLYSGLDLNEIYRGIYESHAASSQITKDGIAAEMNGDYEKAKDLYLEGLREEGIEASKSEICELGECLDTITAASKDSVQSLLGAWRDRYPAFSFLILTFLSTPSFKLDMIEIWDDVINGRKWMLQRIKSLNLVDIELDKYLAAQYLAGAKAARKQHLYSVSERWLGIIQSATAADTFNPDFSYEYCKLIVGKFARDEEVDRKLGLIDNALRHLSFFKDEIQELAQEKRGKFYNLRVSVYEKFINFICAPDSGKSVIAKMGEVRTMFTSKLGGKITSQGIVGYVTNEVTKDSWTPREADCADEKVVALLRKYNFKYARFLDKILRAFESSAIAEGGVDKESIAGEVIIGILRSMSGGFDRAAEFFPRLLQIVEIYDIEDDSFTEEAKAIPTYMFLKWLPQMTAVLDKKVWKHVYPILRKVARKYPNALRFPFNISCEQYNFDRMGPDNKDAVEKLRLALQSQTWDDLSCELRRLQDPVHMYKDCIERVEAIIASQESNKRSKVLEETRMLERFASKHGAELLKILS
ncbi:hypothetical protein HDU97_008222 [Phlyctochytrium planicorne]|nr:hypothetical protein HDU97_008222 [Phlyctochytrium planicorne]